MMMILKQLSKLSKENKLKILAAFIQVLGISFTTVMKMLEDAENARLRRARARRKPVKKLKRRTTTKKEKTDGTTKRPATSA
jgi:hypothetical protein